MQVSSNVPANFAATLAGNFGVQITRSLEKYLEIPIIKGRVNNNTFSEAVSNIKQQSSRWKANSFSQAGRTILIQSNLSSNNNYLMQSFLLPKGVLKQMEKVYSDFFLNKLQSIRYQPLIS